MVTTRALTPDSTRAADYPMLGIRSAALVVVVGSVRTTRLVRRELDDAVHGVVVEPGTEAEGIERLDVLANLLVAAEEVRQPVGVEVDVRDGRGAVGVLDHVAEGVG